MGFSCTPESISAGLVAIAVQVGFRAQGTEQDNRQAGNHSWYGEWKRGVVGRAERCEN